MNFCNYCYTRLDACADCHAAELAAKDKEIDALKSEIKSLQGALRDSLADKDVELDYD
jgi:hypothetical protein